MVLRWRSGGRSGPRSLLARCTLTARRPRPGTRPPALALVAPGRRAAAGAQADSALASYRTRAHGFVFFLAQVGEGLSRTAAAGQGGRAGRGSVLAGPRPEQAGHPRLARRHVPPHRHRLPPRSPRHRHQQFRRRDPDRRGRRGARRGPPALPRRASRSTTSRSATRSPSAPPRARSRCARSRCGPARFAPPAGGRHAVPRRGDGASWCGSASASLPPPISTGSSRTSASCWRTRCSKAAAGCRTGRRSRSGGGPAGSTFRPAASSGAAGRSATTTSTSRFRRRCSPGRPIGGLRAAAARRLGLDRPARRRRSRTWPPRSTARTWTRCGCEVERIAGARALGGLPAQPARRRLAQRSRAGEPGAGARARVRGGDRRSAAGLSDPAVRRPTAPRTTGVTGGLSAGPGDRRHRVSARRRAADPRLQRSAGHRARRSTRCSRRRRARTSATTSCSTPRRLGVRQRLGGRTARRARARRRGEPVGRGRGLARQRDATGRIPPLGAGTYRVARLRSSGRAAASRCGGTCRGGSRSRPARARATTSGRPPKAAGSPGSAPGSSCSPASTWAPAPTGCPPYRSFVLGGRGTLRRRAVPGVRRPRRRRWRTSSGGSRCRCRRSRSARSPSTGRTVTLAPFRRGRVDRAPGRRASLGGQRRGPAGGRRRARVAHAAAPGRGGRRAPDGRVGRHGGREPGVVGNPVDGDRSLAASPLAVLATFRLTLATIEPLHAVHRRMAGADHRAAPARRGGRGAAAGAGARAGVAVGNAGPAEAGDRRPDPRPPSPPGSASRWPICRGSTRGEGVGPGAAGPAVQRGAARADRLLPRGRHRQSVRHRRREDAGVRHRA